MLKKIGVESTVTSNPSGIKESTKIILPGVGSFDYGMKNLSELGLLETLKEKILEGKVPLLGICLGMQLLTEGSEEGSLPGLGFLKAHTRKFSYNYDGVNFKVPHMGWNYISKINDSPLLSNSSEAMRFYFVHSYYVDCKNVSNVVASTSYGISFASIIRKNNIHGVQFHPEKSHKYGMNLLKNFVEFA